MSGRRTEWHQHQCFQRLSIYQTQLNEFSGAKRSPPRPWLTSVLFRALIFAQLRYLTLDGRSTSWWGLDVWISTLSSSTAEKAIQDWQISRWKGLGVTTRD